MVFVAVAPAADVEGILIDKMCSGKMAKMGDGAQQAAAEHTRDCARMPPCEGSGYGVFTASNEFITLDAAGNEKAVAALKATAKKDNLKVRVSGKRTGDKIEVSALKLL